MKENLFEISPFIELTKNKTPKKTFKDGKNRIAKSDINSFNNIGFLRPVGYCIVDADNEIAMDQVERTLALKGILGKVVQYRTTRGKHYILKKPEGPYFDAIASQNGETIFREDKKIASGIDVKATGYVKNNEGEYVFRNGYVQVKKEGDWRINPGELINAFNEDTPVCPYSLLVSHTKIGFYLNEYKSSPRDDYAFRRVMNFRKWQWTEEDFVNFCLEVKILADDPETLNEVEVWARQKWASSEQMGTVKSANLSSEIPISEALSSWNKLLKEEAKEKAEKEKQEKLVKEVEKKVEVEETKTDDFSDPTRQKKDIFKLETTMNFKDDTETGIRTFISIKDYKTLAEAMIEDLNLAFSQETEQLWGIEPAIWGTGDNDFRTIKDIKIFVKRWLYHRFGNVKPLVMNELTAFIESAIPIKKFLENRNIIAFRNRIVDIRTLKEYTPEKNVMVQNLIPNNLIDKSALKTTHKEALEFLNEAMKFWTKGDKQLEKQIYERVGLSMTKDMGEEKAYFLLGNGENGKSQFLKLWVRALGNRNTSHEDLKKLSSNDFSSVNLYGKLANINPDISADTIPDPSIFKRVTSGDAISGSYKGKDIFSFLPYATMIFGANNVPYAKEKGNSDAIDRRLEILPFLNKVDKSMKRDSRNGFTDMIESREVIEVFILKGVLAVYQAFKKGEFTVSRISKKLLDNTIRETNHIYDLIEEMGIERDESENDAYQRYEKWARTNKYNTLDKQEFVNKYIQVARKMGYNIHRETFPGTTAKRKRLILERFDGAHE